MKASARLGCLAGTPMEGADYIAIAQLRSIASAGWDQVLAPGDSTFDQPCPLEHTDMFGYGDQRQAMAARKIGDARLPCPRELSQYSAARLVTEGKEGFV